MRRTSMFFAVLTGMWFACSAARADIPLTTFDGVAISPDGRTVVDVESKKSADITRDVSRHLVLRDVATGAAREIALPCAGRDGCSVTLPSWSHDSKSIAYVVHAAKAKTRGLYVAAAGGTRRTPALLLTFAGTLDAVRYSRDDTKLAALAIPNARKEVGATQAGAAIVGEIGTGFDEQRIAVVTIAKPAVAYASPPDLFVYEYDWMPAGDGFVGTAAHGDGDNNWWIARLYRFDAATSVATEIYKPSSPQQQLASPRVSPDGRFVAFIGGIMSDFGSTGGDVFLLSIGGAASETPASGDPLVSDRDRSNDADVSVTSIAWLCPSTDHPDGLLSTQLRGDRTEISVRDGFTLVPMYAFDSSSQSLGSGDGANVSRSCATSRIAAVVQSYSEAPEIAVRSPGQPWHAITHANDRIPAEATARSIAWKSDDFNVQGWLLEPRNAPAGGKRAMIVSVHGGPAAANVPRFIGRGSTRDLLRHGYAVFLPNPRGSFGQGEAFAAANVKDFGYGDLRDILAGVDAVENVDPTIDDSRLGITGGSYGGFMTMWAVTQTDRFKAAVAGAGIADWVSYYGENGIDEWMIPYFGASAYDDPAVYRKSSPLDFIENVKTPTFEYVGERDVECPAPQSQEFWHALVARGIPTSLVIYAGEGHRIRDPRHVADVTKRTLAWFDGYLKP